MSESNVVNDPQDQSNALNLEKKETEIVKDPEAVLRKNRELLAKIKQNEDKLREVQDLLEQKQQEELANAGKKDELIDALKKQIKDREDRLKQTTQSFALKTVHQQVVETARALGCEKPELILKLADLSTVEVGDDFTVDSEALRSAIQKVQEDVPALFKKTPNAPRDATPAQKIHGMPDNSPRGKTIAELQQMYVESALRQK